MDSQRSTAPYTESESPLSAYSSQDDTAGEKKVEKENEDRTYQEMKKRLEENERETKRREKCMRKKNRRNELRTAKSLTLEKSGEDSGDGTTSQQEAGTLETPQKVGKVKDHHTDSSDGNAVKPSSPSSGSEADVSSTTSDRSAAKKWKRYSKKKRRVTPGVSGSDSDSVFHPDPVTPKMQSKKSFIRKRKKHYRSSPSVQPIPVQGHKPKEHEESKSDTSVLQGVVASGFKAPPMSKPKSRSHREVKGHFPFTPPKRKKLSKKSTRHTSDAEYGGSSYISSSSSDKSHPRSDVSTDEPLWTPRYSNVSQRFFTLVSEDSQDEPESVSPQPVPAVTRSEEILQQLCEIQPSLPNVYHALLGCRGMPVRTVPRSSQHTGFHLHTYLESCVAGGRYADALSVLTALLDCGVLCSQSGVSVIARLADMTVDVEHGCLILGPTCFQSMQIPHSLAMVQMALHLAKRLREAAFAYHAGELAVATSPKSSCHLLNGNAAASEPTTAHQFVAALSSFIHLIENHAADGEQVDNEYLVNFFKLD